MRSRSTPATDLALIATFTAIIVVTSVVAIPVGAVPITLQTFSVLLAGAVLGARRGFLAVLLYLLLGAIGLPVFAGGASGLPTFVGPTAGYLIGMPFAALLTGFWVQRILRKQGTEPVASRTLARGVSIFFAAFISEIATMHVLGVAVMMWRLQLTLVEALVIDASFIPLGIVKVVLVAIVATAVHRAFPALLPTPHRSQKLPIAATEHTP